MASGEFNEREELYRYAEKLGVGITVMKPFAGGQLLDERRSPLGNCGYHNGGYDPYKYARYHYPRTLRLLRSRRLSASAQGREDPRVQGKGYRHQG